MTDYKPLDLGPIRHSLDAADKIPTHEMRPCLVMLVDYHTPALLAEVVRLRREVCEAHCFHGTCYQDGKSACPTCQAAALDGWDPSKPLDWKPEAP